MMRLFIRKLALLSAASLVSSAVLAMPASAHTLTVPNSLSAQNEWNGAGGGLGSSHRFPTVAAAQAHCGGDEIVWSDGVHLTYYLSGAPQYGTTQDGFYACQAEANSAGFQQAP